MAFHDIRLPDDVERGATGGPAFSTTVFELSSGFEKRNINWERPRSLFDIGYGIQTEANFDLVLDFFYAREGRAHSFRFKDWSDFLLSRQSIGTTDGGTTTTFQLFKRYTSGTINYDRVLTKPLDSGGQAWVNNIAQTVTYSGSPGATDVDINPLTGIVTLGATHAATSGQDIEIETEFDIPVRFDVDQFNLTLELFDRGAIQSLPVREVRGE